MPGLGAEKTSFGSYESRATTFVPTTVDKTTRATRTSTSTSTGTSTTTTSKASAERATASTTSLTSQSGESVHA